VRERLGRSLDWLLNEIGVGERGLLKVGSGDWSDGISFLASDRRAFGRGGVGLQHGLRGLCHAAHRGAAQRL
jgi:hypothetical protein